MDSPQNGGAHNSQSQWCEWDFIDEPPERFLCGVCFQVMQYPHLPTCCGQQYLCTNCISQVRKHAERFARLNLQASGDAKPACPFCRTEGFKTITSADMQASIHSLGVRCPHTKEGCKWTGTIREAQSDHLSLRCMYHPIACPNNCGENIRRFDVHQHSKVCPEQAVSCPFAPVGCKRSITRKHIATHAKYSLHEHFQQTTEKICQTSTMYASLVDSLQSPPHEQELQHREAKIAVLRQSISDAQENNSELEQGLRVIQQEVNSFKEELQKSKAVFAAEMKRKDDELKDLRELEAALRNELATVPNIRTPPIRIPPVTFLLDNFTERKEHNENWFSPPFYSHGGGYKMCLQIFPNGCGRGEGTHVSLYTRFMPGEYDDALQWPFEGRITVILENQQNFLTNAALKGIQSTKGNFTDEIYLDGQGSFGRRVQVPKTEVYGEGSGFDTFIALGQLSPFLSSDTLKITIMPILFLPL